MKAVSELKQGLGQLWGSIADGWRELRERASGALTRFGNGHAVTQEGAEKASALSAPAWALLAGEVFEDERRIVVRLEIPGLEKDDFQVQVTGDELVVRGEKRFEQEQGNGRYRVFQCAYGSFRRAIPLPVPVQADSARSTYRNGVLRIELPKREPLGPKLIHVKVH